MFYILVQDTVYGERKISDRLALGIIESSAMQRLKGISQYSTCMFLSDKYNTTRFDHSLGVYFLLKKLGASREEQIAGLLHDISHTAFSHVVDFLYGRSEAQDFHESFHEEVIRNSEIPRLLRFHGLDVSYILDENNFKLLEKELPELCADRIDYFLRDCLITGKVAAEGVAKYKESLIVIGDEIVVRDYATARKLAEDFMGMNLDFWGTHFVVGSFNFAAEALKIALENGYISQKDLFLTDREVMDKLTASKDEKILKRLQLIKNHKLFSEGTEKDFTVFGKTKARFIDPRFVEEGVLLRLSEADQDFGKRIEAFKSLYEKGFYVKIG